MVSSVNPSGGTDETAIWYHGANNRLLMLARRFLSAGLSIDDGLGTTDETDRSQEGCRWRDGGDSRL